MMRFYQDTLLFVVVLGLALWVGVRQVKMKSPAIQHKTVVQEFSAVTQR